MVYRKRKRNSSYPSRRSKRYRVSSKATRRYRRIARRKRTIRRTIRRGGPILHIKKLVTSTVTIAAGSTTSSNEVNFKFSDVSAQCIPEIDMYQFYKINKIVYKFIPRMNVVQENAAYLDNWNFGFLGSGIDYSGNLGPFNDLPDVFDDATGMITRGYKPHTRVFKPKVAQMLYAGVATTQYQNRVAGWVDCADEDVFHYGLRWYWTGSVPATISGRVPSFVYDLHVKYYLSFKQRKQ